MMKIEHHDEVLKSHKPSGVDEIPKKSLSKSISSMELEKIDPPPPKFSSSKDNM
jgi:hypothetical protein